MEIKQLKLKYSFPKFNHTLFLKIYLHVYYVFFEVINIFQLNFKMFCFLN